MNRARSNNPSLKVSDESKESPRTEVWCDTASITLIDAKRAAELLDISKRTLWTLSASNAIPSVRIGKKLRRYQLSHLNEWIRQGCPTAPGSGDRVRRSIDSRRAER
jgi:excisionase family DNA binding protein